MANQQKDKEVSLSIVDVARYILLRESNSLNSKRLQELCYYTQAWYLVWNDQPLFKEDFEAWHDGPICPQLYSTTKEIVNLDELEKEYKEKGFCFVDLTEEQIQNIDEILDCYRELNNEDLMRRIIHERPWQEARSDLIESPINGHYIISKSSMEDYYRTA